MVHLITILISRLNYALGTMAQQETHQGIEIFYKSRPLWIDVNTMKFLRKTLIM